LRSEVLQVARSQGREIPATPWLSDLPPSEGMS
jgi:NADH dehydrogenase/NADH:ubiquinone oxidoreductase subunit G